MTEVIAPLQSSEDHRTALAQLKRFHSAQTALTERLGALLDTFDDPLVDRVKWEALIDEVMAKRRQVAERIEVLRLQLGIATAPAQLH